MLKKIFIYILITFISTFCYAQEIRISGSIKDTTSNTNVKNAVIALLTPKDSVLVSFTRANNDGSYSIDNIMPGKYIIMITHPAFADFVDNIEIKNTSEVIPFISLTPKTKLLQEIIIKSGSPIRIKGDTTIYTADSFKVSANANVEELLKKLPGIQVDKDGKIKAMGQTVEKVLVDGEEFFGDDPGMAVKNLRADAVKEVQVFDKKSDQAEFTGIDDGKTQKTINLTLKEDRKKGYFGKADIAGGLMKHIDNRYNSNILLSSFKGKRKISGFLLTGNTGQDGLSWEDDQKYTGSDDVTMNMTDDGDVMFIWRGGEEEEPRIDPQNGFMTNVNAGLQYSNKFKYKTTINISPKYNSQVYSNRQQTYIQTLLQGDSSFNNKADLITNVNRHNIKLKAVYDVKLDSMNTLKFSANTNFYHTETENIGKGELTDQSGILKNDYTSHSQSAYDKSALSGTILFKHKFKKTRRTFSITTDWNSLTTNGNNFLRSTTTIPLNTPIVIDQMKDIDKANAGLTSKLVYTEPLNKNYSLELGYQMGYTYGNNDQVTYGWSALSGKYDQVIDSLTNHSVKVLHNMYHLPN